MNSPGAAGRTEATRRALIGALTEALVESPDGQFSVQEVADRAGVTHRTVYNHFANREAMLDAVVEANEPEDAEGSDNEEVGLSVRGMPEMIGRVYQLCEQSVVKSRAIGRLIGSSRRHAQLTQARTGRFESVLARDIPELSADDARRLAVAIRMFGTQYGWHLLTEHFALGEDDARHTATWATRVLLEAALAGDLPSTDPDRLIPRGLSDD